MPINGFPRLQSMLRILAIPVFTLLFASPGYSEVYKWIDENGKTHFGDRPPNPEKAEEIGSQLQDVNVSTDLSSPQMIQRAEQARIKEREQAYSQRVKQAQSYDDELDKWCRKAKARLHNLQGRVRFYDEDGKDVYVSEKERRQREENLKAEIERTCI